MYHADGIRVKQLIVVPRILMGMHEHCSIVQAIVVVNDVCQIYHCLVAFVCRNGKVGCRVIDSIFHYGQIIVGE